MQSMPQEVIQESMLGVDTGGNAIDPRGDPATPCCQSMTGGDHSVDPRVDDEVNAADTQSKSRS